MKKIALYLLILMLLLAGMLLAGCQGAQEASSGPDGSMNNNDGPGRSGAMEPGGKIVITLGVPKAPPALPLLRMAETQALGENVEFKLDIWDASEQLITMVQDGDHDMFAFPLTVAAKLHNKGVDIWLTNINTWGVTYFVTSDPAVQTWGDLKGKTVYIPLQSSPPDVLTQYFLEAAGLKVGQDVEIIYSSTSEISQLLMAGKIAYATQIEPLVTAAMLGNNDLRIAFDFEEEWKKIKGQDSIIPNAGLGCTAAFLEEQPELVARFEAEYEKALNWTLEHPLEAGKLAEETLGLKQQVVAQAMPNLGLLYKSAQDSQTDLKGLYELLYALDPATIGGKVPDETLYYEQE
jgi:NitT/TauT family transport system substrate-binding protein